ncbi:MAG: hypothetical protein RIQ89_566 [Bacteroidota bacterium]|jgi:hypothetical protein
MAKVTVSSDDGYSISPKSGRLKKKIRYRWKNDVPLLSRRRWKKYAKVLFYLALIIGVVLTVMVMSPDLREELGKKLKEREEWRKEDD